MDDLRIAAVEWAVLEGRRPRHAGCNARLGDHGVKVRVPVARVATVDGAAGFGRCTATQAQAQALVGMSLHALFEPGQGATGAGLAFDYPLWDLAAKRQGQPVYALAAAVNGQAVSGPLRVPCYDTSLYFDDLHLADHDEAASLLAAEAQEGRACGHNAFKIKVGRGARHMALAEGTERDIAVIRAVRAAAGTGAALMIDANNGYNLNLAKQVLAATAGCRLLWLEEAFHEDAVLYEDLRSWLAAQGLALLIADGEGQASPTLLEWAERRVVDVIQYDIFGYGFTRWLGLGRQLDPWGVCSAPHHYGGHVGNYVSAHLAPAIAGFAYVEWDEASTPGLSAPGYHIENGYLHVPATPGFGLEMDEERFARAVAEAGYTAQ